MKDNELSEKLKKMGRVEWVLMAVTLLGVVFCLWSLFSGITADSQVQVEYLKAGDNEKEQSLKVDVGGGVENPGVYELVTGSSVKDALIMAGGYSEKADRQRIEMMINLADKLTDGQKIFFPTLSTTTTLQGYAEANNEGKLININLATAQELDTLWGIGAAKARDIINNRPYKKIEELVEKKIISKSVLDKNKSLMSVF